MPLTTTRAIFKPEMQKKPTFFSQVVSALASLKLAVVVIVLLGVLTAVGTFVEARYNSAPLAKKYVYDTIWMYLVMGLLAVNLLAVMMDRWPWKRRHIPFVLAHIGILILLAGSVLTAKFGLDGSLRVGVNSKNRWVSLPETELSVWTSFDGDRFTKLLERPVDFDLHPPDKEPLAMMTDAGELKVLRYVRFVVPSRKVVSTDDERAGAGLRFQVQNANVNVIEWLVQKKTGDVVTHDFGPAQIHFGSIPTEARHGKNEVFFKLRERAPTAKADVPLELDYKVYYKDPARKPLVGVVKEGERFQAGWMDLGIHILRLLPKAEETWDFIPQAAATDLTTSAIEIEFQGKKYWLQLNDTLKLFSERAVYILAYANRRVDLGFDIFLEKFEVGRYQGTMRAASYQSVVRVDGLGERVISMNDPLKHEGKTVYQASFQDGPDGQPVASIFSVNNDPGRWLKYLGSLILSFGVVWLFYDKRRSARAMAPKELKEV